MSSSGSWWWKPEEEEDDGAAAAASSPVLSGEYQALEMSTMVSALAHVVAGGYDDPTPMAASAGGYRAHLGGSYYSAASAQTPDQFAAAGEQKRALF
jgi:hypothetical protein